MKASLYDLGMRVDGGGIFVQSAGMYSSGGLTVGGTGVLRVTGGLSVNVGSTIGFSKGLQATGGMTVDSADPVEISNGLSVMLGGAQVTNGLTVSGSFYSSSRQATSDRRLKTNIQPINQALQKVAKVNGVYFNWIQNERDGRKTDKRRHVGMIAQQLEQVLPEVVHHDGQYLSVDYASTVALIIEAVKELEISMLKTADARKRSLMQQKVQLIANYVKDVILKIHDRVEAAKKRLANINERMSVLEMEELSKIEQVLVSASTESHEPHKEGIPRGKARFPRQNNQNRVKL